MLQKGERVMTVSRREFLVISGVAGAGLALSSLGIDMGPVKAYAQELKKIDKMKSAKQSTTICPYCAVGCGLICSTDTKAKKIINIEGDPDHPINEGALCAKGASLFQTTSENPDRLKKVRISITNWRRKFLMQLRTRRKPSSRPGHARR